MPKIAVFTDFDGTITTKDLGDELFIQHGKFEPYHSQLLEGELLIEDYWKTLFRELNPGTNEETVRQFAVGAEYDPYFKTFADFCRKESIPLKVVSDGFDAYIKPVLENMGLGDLPVACNEMIFEDDGPIPSFPGASESCDCLCASCKRNSVLKELPEGHIIVFIGDGYSDFCAAAHADIIFAKKNLAAHCNEEKIPHHPFSNFFDVYRIFRSIIEKGKLKTRRQAELLRKKAYETE